ncbi:MAG: glycine cleavage system protein GcvH [Phycisphaerae bacterium]|nr:glycine cleavage system protein GcvH [Phycisphaerae bacterium]
MVKKDLYYTKEHEWAKIDGKVATVGITDHAQESLSELTFVEPPQLNKLVKTHGELAVVESSKAASDIYAPVSGKVIEVNNALESNPELVNDDCYGDGWICKIEMSNPDDAKQLMSAEQYEEYLITLEA